MQLRVGICEDDPFTLATLTASMSFQDVEVSISVSTASQALEQFKINQPHAMVIDLHLGEGPTGVDLARSCRAISPTVGIVFLTSFESPKLMNKALEELPDGSQYLTKREMGSIEQLLQAIQKSISRDRKSSTPENQGLSKLTARQIEVLKYIAEGSSNNEIAKQLNLSHKTVEGIILRISRNLELKSNPDSNQRIQMARAYLRGIGKISG
jgi:DNA-binding NarL/FixJ family response regulator